MRVTQAQLRLQDKGWEEGGGGKEGKKEDRKNEMQRTYSVRFCPSSLPPLHPAEDDLDLVEPREGTQARRPTVSSGQT